MTYILERFTNRVIGNFCEFMLTEISSFGKPSPRTTKHKFFALFGHRCLCAVKMRILLQLYIIDLIVYGDRRPRRRRSNLVERGSKG